MHSELYSTKTRRIPKLFGLKQNVEAQKRYVIMKYWWNALGIRIASSVERFVLHLWNVL